MHRRALPDGAVRPTCAVPHGARGCYGHRGLGVPGCDLVHIHDLTTADPDVLAIATARPGMTRV
jgi:hypothetical protein